MAPHHCGREFPDGEVGGHQVGAASYKHSLVQAAAGMGITLAGKAFSREHISYMSRLRSCA